MKNSNIDSSKGVVESPVEGVPWGWMLKDDPALKEEFEAKMKSDSSFRADQSEILS